LGKAGKIRHLLLLQSESFTTDLPSLALQTRTTEQLQSPTMKIFQLIAAFLMAVSVSAFTPAPRLTTATTLSMGLFDFLQPKKEDKKGLDGNMDADVFGGKGKRITIRDDEDNAMWVDTPPKKKGGK
jgi:ABC-type tungstate transport system permease subunit